MFALRRGTVVAAVLGVVLALGAVAPADAGGAGRIKARIAKKPGGPYVVQVHANIGAGKAKIFYVKVKNKTPDQPFDVNMTQGPDNADYKQRYFRFDGTNITPAVEDSGYEFHLGAQQVKRFELKIKAIGVSPAAYCSYVNLEELGVGPGSGQVRVGVNGSDCD